VAETSSKRRVLALVALWGVVMGGVGSASCYGHTCDGDVQIYGRAPGEGQLIDEDTWESTPIDGDWIPFTRQRIWIFQMRQLGDRSPYEVSVDISAEKNPVALNGNWTTGSGNLAEKSGVGPGTINVKNNTCADYYIRLVAHAKPRPPEAVLPDAAAPTDASTADADAGD
jgi:hypothetical protein